MRSRFSPAALAVFELLHGPWRRRRVRHTLVAGLPRGLDAGRPLLLAANHVSGWDGFTLREVHRLLRPRGPLYTLMAERELRRFPVLRLLGVFGVDAESAVSVRGALRFVRERARERPDLTLSFFPQGRIWPSHRRPLGFLGGIEAFARALSPCVVLPVAIHHESLAGPPPTVLVSAGEPIDGDAVQAARLERAVAHESDRLLAFAARHGEEVARHWPGPCDRLGEVAAAPASVLVRV